MHMQLACLMQIVQNLFQPENYIFEFMEKLKSKNSTKLILITSIENVPTSAVQTAMII
jgi:hypothetical protein